MRRPARLSKYRLITLGIPPQRWYSYSSGGPDSLLVDPPFLLGLYDQPPSPGDVYSKGLTLVEGTTYSLVLGNSTGLYRLSGPIIIEAYTFNTTFTAGGTNYTLVGPVYSGGSLPAPPLVITTQLSAPTGSRYIMTNQTPTAPNYFTTLNWTYPNLYVLHDTLDIVIHQVIVQRSTNTRATPGSADGDGNSSLGPVIYTLLPDDPAWTTLPGMDLRPEYTVVGSDPTVYPIATTATDNVSLDHLMNYRAIMIYSIGSVYWELDWNVVTVWKPYDLSAVRTQGRVDLYIS